MIVYRYFDTKIIKELIIEIGKHKYEQALENMEVTQKPLTMKGYYLEATEDYVKLCYKYPSRHILILMDIEHFNNIPASGWERVKVER